MTETYVRCISNFLRNHHVIFQSSCAFTHSSQECMRAPTSYPANICNGPLFCVLFLNFSHSNQCVVVSHCDFNFHFPNNVLAVLNTFSLLLCCLYVFFGEECSNPHTFFELVVLLLLSIKTKTHSWECSQDSYC